MLIIILICGIILCSCNANSIENREFETNRYDNAYHVSKITEAGKTKRVDYMNGIWISQFDMHPIYRDGNKQREISDFKDKTATIFRNLKKDGFDTVFLQVRPNGDSMYDSDVYPCSKYIAGSYGGELEYDAVEIFLAIAKENGFSVHAWINPFRLCSLDELTAYGKGRLYEWLREGIGKRIELGEDDLLYLDPSYEEATALIVSGVDEILNRYDFDGIHLDDYFYPTEFEFNDDSEFINSDYSDLSDFRRSNIDRTVRAIYETAHLHEKVFGISPAGNIYSLSNGWYVDIYKWCSTDGYVDYIMPQLYFGFKNETCPFDTILSDWCNAVTNSNIKLYIGLSAAKCALGSEGVADVYAGENGKYEWRDNKDILSQSLRSIYKEDRTNGFCIFSYSSFYDPITGEDNELTHEEKYAFCEIVTVG